MATSAVSCRASGTPAPSSNPRKTSRWFKRIVKSLKPRRSRTSLTAAHTSASTTGEVEPMASTSH